MKIIFGLVLRGTFSASLFVSFVALATAQTAPSLATLYSFTSQTGASPSVPIGGVIVGANGDGVRPIAGLVMGANGEWTETIIHSFQSGSDGATPESALTVGKDGALYGTTYAGGYTGLGTGGCVGDGCGTVFELQPPSTPGGPWTETILYRFTGADGRGSHPLDGKQPIGALIIGDHGELYGTAAGGAHQIYDCPFVCGAVFELRPPENPGAAWTEAVLHAFTGPPHDGSVPFATLAMGRDRALYGTTYWGGNSDYCCYGCGTVFELQPPSAAGGTWTETIIHNFHGAPADGFTPIAGLAFGGNGRLYGSTTMGGPAPTCGTAPGQYYCGILFELTPPAQPGGAWKETILHDFTGQSGDGDGSDPHAALVHGKDGMPYGTTTGGGAYGWGTAFQLKP
jgi:hypothetical protein